MEALAVRWLCPNEEIVITTPCLDCGETITVRMEGDRVLEVDPADAVGYQVSPFVQWREGSSAFN
jgi:hypothetical protein